jgi:RNA polymerase sigma factor (sigma-70 family)
MANDNELLREYARSASEAAFADLVNRHVNMVYSAALREADGDAGLAQEFTQLVFIELSRKAASLGSHPALAGWLYTSVRWVAANSRRAEERRRERQVEYQFMTQLHSSDSPDATWRQVRPVLDHTLHELDETDRTAIVLRFFEDLNLKQIGVQLGISENAARMRVDRALERFQALLAKRGITSTHSALTAALIACAIVSAPLGLAASISAHVIGSATVVAATKATLLKSSVTAKKVILASMTAVLVLGTIGSIHFIRTHRAFAKQIHRWFMR